MFSESLISVSLVLYTTKVGPIFFVFLLVRIRQVLSDVELSDMEAEEAITLTFSAYVVVPHWPVTVLP